MKRLFNHPQYKAFANKFEVDDSGKVYNIKTNRFLTLHKNNKSKMLFVRLSAKGKNYLTMGFAKLVLLTFKGKSYKKGNIAIHLKSKQNDNRVSNLVWGTRKLQTKIQMSKKSHSNRVKLMAKKYHGKLSGIRIDEKMIVKMRLMGMTGRDIAQAFRCHEVTVSIILKKHGYRTVRNKLIKIK